MMATQAQHRDDPERFWQRMAVGLSIFIVFGFVQFALRGLVDVPRVPLWVHLHGLVMLAWLALLVVQPRLITSGDRALHRRLGRIGAWLATLIVGLAVLSGIAAVATARQPPFFTPPYFLTLVMVEALVFGALVWAAIRRRQMTDWHRRLMIGATIIILEPALGRILPMPLMIGWADFPIAAIQLGVVGIVALHDRRTRGTVHPATVVIALVVLATRAAIPLLAMTPPVVALAARIAG